MRVISLMMPVIQGAQDMMTSSVTRVCLHYFHLLCDELNISLGEDWDELERKAAKCKYSFGTRTL
jgi:hypothetical protein